MLDIAEYVVIRGKREKKVKEDLYSS